VRRAWASVSAGLPLLLAGCGADRHPQTTLDPASDIARDIAGLQALIFWWIMGVLVVVTAVLVYVLFRFRDRPDAPEPRRIHGNNTLEILWTLGPAVIVALILVPTVRTIFRSYQSPPDGAILVEAIGHQWWWEFRYPDLGVVTANQIHVPAGRPVHLTLSSADVLHNFWAPRLGGKRYTYPRLPGPGSERENFNVLQFTVDEPGAYTGQCAEFCGTSHAHMRFMVVAMDEVGFDDWVADMGGGPPLGAGEAAGGAAPGAGDVAGAPPGAPSPEDAVPADTSAAGDPAPAPQDTAPAPQDTAPVIPSNAEIERGRALFTSRPCIACHAIQGVSQGVLGPNLTRFGDRWSVGAGALDNTQENLEAWIRDPGAIKADAKMPGARVEGGGMPPTNLTDEEISAIAAYLLSLK
jgi:cytochrome c oxidase subunit 2